MTEHEFGFETRAIHAGQAPDDTTGAVVTPIYQTSTYAQDEVGVHRGYEYSRTANPTRTALERCLASLEGAASGFAFASGMAAEDAVLRLLPADSHIVIPNDAYGGTYRLVSKVFGPAGLKYSAVDLSDTDQIADALWTATASTPPLSWRCSSATRRWRPSAIPGCGPTPATRWRSARCGTSAAWWLSRSPEARRLRSSWWGGRGCSRSPSHWARSSR